jgi:hypothetical protein
MVRRKEGEGMKEERRKEESGEGGRWVREDEY